MKTLLVINIGSSSLKFAVWQGPRLIVRGGIDHFGPQARQALRSGSHQSITLIRAKNASAALQSLRVVLTAKKISPDTVAHRIVHGGGSFDRPTRLNSAVLQKLQALIPLAPLHMPVNLLGVTTARKFWPQATQWAVFDTALYHHLPEYAQRYALPLALSKKYHIRKYGFHGISHQWAMRQAAKKLGWSNAAMNAVSLHLGSGDSMTLWKKGRAVDTSMGFTPLEGLTMSTRSGDLDPSIPMFLMRQGWALDRVEKLLQQQSGLFGLTGMRDMRDILGAAGQPVKGWPGSQWTAAQRKHARLALTMFIYDIERYLGAYLGQLNVKAPIILTGLIGCNPYIQHQLRALPIAKGRRLIVVPADEETAIAVAVGHVVP